MRALDTSRYASIHEARAELGAEHERSSWLLNMEYPSERQVLALESIEAKLSKMTSYPGYQKTVKNILQAQSWDEFQEHWWTLKAASYLAERNLLREMEVALPSGSFTDMKGEVLLEGQPTPFYAEAKSWRFHPAPEIINLSSDLPLDGRVERMKEKLLKQLPEDSLGIWAWDKMRDGISGSHILGSHGPKLGVEERQIISEVCGAVPQLVAVMVRALDGDLDNLIWTVPSRSSKWPQSQISPLIDILNSAAP